MDSPVGVTAVDATVYLKSKDGNSDLFERACLRAEEFATVGDAIAAVLGLAASRDSSGENPKNGKKPAAWTRKGKSFPTDGEPTDLAAQSGRVAFYVYSRKRFDAIMYALRTFDSRLRAEEIKAELRAEMAAMRVEHDAKLKAVEDKHDAELKEIKTSRAQTFEIGQAPVVVRRVLELATEHVQKVVDVGAPDGSRAAALEAALRHAKAEKNKIVRDDLVKRVNAMIKGDVGRGEHELPIWLFYVAWTEAFPGWTELVGDEGVIEFARQNIGKPSLRDACNKSVHSAKISIDTLAGIAKTFRAELADFVLVNSRPPVPSADVARVLEWIAERTKGAASSSAADAS